MTVRNQVQFYFHMAPGNITRQHKQETYPLPQARHQRILILILLAAAGALLLLWLLRPPQLAGYELRAMPLTQSVVATGRVESVSRAQVGVEVTGVVLERPVKEGDSVKPGDMLLRLRSDDIEARLREAEVALEQLAQSTRPQADLSLARAQSRLTQARREATRRRDLMDRGLLSREALEQAEEEEIIARNAVDSARVAAAAAAPGGAEDALLSARLASLRAQLEKTRVRSEVAGKVLTRNVEPGDLVQPGKTLFTIALRGHTEVVVPLDEKNLHQLALGQPAMVIADAYPAETFAARVNFIAPSIDSGRGTVDVHLSLDTVPDFLREDMTVTANIETGRRESAVALPNDSLLSVQGNGALVVRVEEGRLRRVPVVLGLRGTGMSEVREGLMAGDHILANPVSGLSDGTRVTLDLQATAQTDQDTGHSSRNEMPIQLQ